MAITITSWAAVSPAGIGSDALADACSHAGRASRAAADVFPGKDVPAGSLAQVDGFDITAILGTRKGTRVFDRTTSLALAAVHLALQKDGIGSKAGMGLVLGSQYGSPQSLLDFMAETYEARPPHLVSPEGFPRAVMNYAAGQCATWFGLTGPNATLAGAQAVGISVLSYACQLVAAGTPRILAGSVQEATPAALWLASHRAAARAHPLAPQAEGAAMFLLEAPDGRRQVDGGAVAHLLACRSITIPVADLQIRIAVAADCVTQSLAQAGLRPDAIDRIVIHSCGIPEADDVEAAVIGRVFGRVPEECLQVSRILGGDCGAAAAALQLGCLLGGWQRGADDTTSHGCVVAVDPGGTVGCAVLRRSS